MTDKLRQMEARYTELTRMLADPAVIADRVVWQKAVKEHAQLEKPVELYRVYVANESAAQECLQLLHCGDAEMEELAREELERANEQRERLTEELKIALLPVDPDDEKNVIVEVRPAAGGEEAALFGAQIVRMYMRYAERERWKIEEIDMNYTDLGGIKEVTFSIGGKGAFSRLKFESGVHRVQRVPETESQGRVHTSTVTVAVLPEAEEIEIEIAEKDLKIDTYRSGGAGGQHVNKTDSAVRMTHLPTGIVVTSQDERSQIKNREKAMKVLRSRLYEHYRTIADSAYAGKRRSQVGTGDRSEKIRTYNYPQNRVTDHRIGKTMYNLTEFMDGDLNEMIQALQLAEQAALLAGEQNVREIGK